MIYVCAQSTASRATRAAEHVPGSTPGQAVDSAASFALTGFGQQPGHLTAIDARAGEITWQKELPRVLLLGLDHDAGNLIFVGRNDGELEAYNADNGELLWSFQTGAGANNDGDHLRARRQAVRRLLRGRQLAGRHAARRQPWLFSLDGTMEEAKGVGAEAEGAATPARPGRADRGRRRRGGRKAVWADNCAGCHGLAGTGGNGGPDLTSLRRPRARSA